jgi:anti-anti-sigma factor
MDGSSSSELAALVTIVTLEGEFDVSDRRRLADAFAVAAASPTVIVDFSKTSYIDSSALHCVLMLRQSVRDNQSRLVLVGLHDSVRRVFEICHLEPLFDIRPNLESARDGDLDPLRLQRLTLASTSMGADSAAS